jgi:hypothetical protein
VSPIIEAPLPFACLSLPGADGPCSRFLPTGTLPPQGGQLYVWPPPLRQYRTTERLQRNGVSSSTVAVRCFALPDMPSAFERRLAE